MQTALNKQTAIVTGASRGIGRSIALALGREGMDLALIARSEENLKAVAEAVVQAGGTARIFPCDLADAKRTQETASEIIDRLGRVDALINNAGAFLERAITDMTLEEWNRILQVNLTSAFILSKLALSHMKTWQRGRIINIASTSGVQGYLYQAAYCVSKHGMMGFSKVLSIEAKPHNVHVHSICPGGVDTDFIKGTYLGERLAPEPKIHPDDIAEMVVFVMKQPDNIELPEILVKRFVP